ncbi:hypothetical protein ABZX85_35945 [Streptomyces sp. NPDC004539]|uniref:hypothetical protein n=1 Tax=Streptomyces sp. NPDC004539 TaxID=3154280 RepID=UPI0033B7A1D9
MPETTLAWFHTLSDSVAALGAAAREYRMAHQATQATAWHFDPARLTTEDGQTRVPGQYFFQPHVDAHRTLKEVYGAAELRLKDLYENTALAYAYGTAAVIKAIRDGEHPHHVEVTRVDSRYGLTAERLPDLAETLALWDGSADLAALRDIVIQHERARQVAREFSYFEDLADYRGHAVTEASEYAVGLADAAFTYAEAAERALHFVLLGIRASRAAGESE